MKIAPKISQKTAKKLNKLQTFTLYNIFTLKALELYVHRKVHNNLAS